MSLAVVADAGPLIPLDEIDSLSLLSLVDQLYVPETVYAELEVGDVPDAIAEIEYERVAPESSVDGGEQLDPGETAALAVATERDAVLLTDDLAARKTAEDAGVEVHGSIGIISATPAATSTGRRQRPRCGLSSARQAST